jgi:hypothetical protein
MRINLGGVQTFVTEHRLNVANVRTAFEHQGSHRVPKDVAGTALRDFGSPHIAMRPE